MKISIITICLNSEATIENTIESVVSQKDVDIEYLIIDGGSTDHTLSIISKYEDQRFQKISEKDEGISDAFNKGIRMATGDLIGIINSDDQFIDGALSRAATVIKPETDVLFGNGIRAYQDGTAKRYLADPNPQKLHDCMSMVHPSVFVRREAYQKYGLFKTEYKYVMDRELLLRFLNNGAVFQYDPFFYSFYSMGGVSDQYYINKVLPEEYKININDGKSSSKCMLMKLKSEIRMKCVNARNILGLDHDRVPIDKLTEEIMTGNDKYVETENRKQTIN